METVPTNVPGGLGIHLSEPDPAEADKLWLFWRGGDWNPTFSYTEDARHWVPARELVALLPGQRPYAKYVGDSTAEIHGIFTDGHPRQLEEQPALPALRGREPVRRRRTQARRASTTCRCTIRARPHLHVLRPRRARVGPRHRAHPGGPAAGRLHAPCRGTATRSITPTTTAPSGSAERSSRRARAPVVSLGRGDVRPLRSALRVPVAHDRPLEPGRAVVHAGRRPELDDATAHELPGRLRHPPRQTAPARRPPTGSSSSRPTSARSASPTTAHACTHSTSKGPQLSRRRSVLCCACANKCLSCSSP